MGCEHVWELCDGTARCWVCHAQRCRHRAFGGQCLERRRHGGSHIFPGGLCLPATAGDG
ncbi:hypothetical protein [Puerhibacterium puerhi]|uniref:hypothetical protein n=1 Tax=Puerhibacterium puerhi TaxID=2692623 RepID=UPI001356C5F4|nr:hypothetical protein [Puerhibacterium puerhi]